ncbi:hypothetical protein BJ322DRAFT_1031898 [Thelephora terrestris]|uniref:Mitochondrial import inner membrane translocase subunit TIM16 n=1 Tax=Thelephora terrestris TaxID=56493 RepID=A0A9P6HSB4_9AGAM|nr:hypothetical protein BJ322DRAFT_1031898 [Thelephora terrestris]
MSAPRAIIQILITGTQIFGKALYAAGTQAVKNAKQRPEALGADVAGVGKATSGSVTDKLTREHRLTLDEAHLILNTKKEDQLERVLTNYEHLFKQNSPPETTTPAKPVAGKRAQAKYHSHYLQSKVVRARERIEAEHKLQSTISEQGPSSTLESAPPNP